MSYAGPGFVDQVLSYLQRRGYTTDWNAQMQAPSAVQQHLATWQTTPRDDTDLSQLSDSRLIYEMLQRGFAVMPMPKDGGVPGVLKS